MEEVEEIINCSNSTKNFIVMKFKFNYEKDKEILIPLIKKGIDLGKKVNPVLARNSSQNRENKQILINSVAGVISEYLWKHYLNKKLNQKNIFIRETELTDIRNQVDLEIDYKNQKIIKTAEVRSSFPYAGIKNGVCKYFDIIGWYANSVKLKEVKKDFYLRVLFPYREIDFAKFLKEEFEVFLVGGATKELLENSPYATDREFQPFYEQQNTTNTKYRVIRPIVNAYDVNEITEEISKL